MDRDEVIQKILKFNPSLSREEVEKLVKAKREEMGRYFTDDVIARVVASDLGVEISADESKHKLSISELVSGLGDVTIVGRLIMVLPPKTFSRATEMGTGKFVRLIVGDKTGSLNVVLWNSSADKAATLRQGQLVRISHGYLRETRDGTLELNVGERGEIEIAPQEPTSTEEYPPLTSFLTKVGNIARKQGKIHVRGRVANFFPTSTFQRSDKSTGKLMRLTLEDETGQIRVSAWNEKADELANLKQDDVLQVVNARVKVGLDKKLELNVESLSQVNIFPEEAMETSIAKLQPATTPITIAGTIASKPLFREVTTAKGEKVGLTTFELQDATGKIWVSAWRKHAETTRNLAVGERIRIKDAYAKKGFSDKLEVSTRTMTSIKPLPEEEQSG